MKSGLIVKKDTIFFNAITEQIITSNMKTNNFQTDEIIRFSQNDFLDVQYHLRKVCSKSTKIIIIDGIDNEKLLYELIGLEGLYFNLPSAAAYIELKFILVVDEKIQASNLILMLDKVYQKFMVVNCN